MGDIDEAHRTQRNGGAPGKEDRSTNIPWRLLRRAFVSSDFAFPRQLASSSFAAFFWLSKSRSESGPVPKAETPVSPRRSRSNAVRSGPVSEGSLDITDWKMARLVGFIAPERNCGFSSQLSPADKPGP